MNEAERIALLAERFARAGVQGFVGAEDAQGLDAQGLGIGDDAAVLPVRAAEDLVLSVDAAVEGVHFRRSFGPLDVLAERATTAALSDLAAMGSTPRALLDSLVLPPAITEAELSAIGDGIARAAARARCPVLGGNLSAGAELALHTTVVGAVPRGGALRRDGARPGDALFVAGELGAAALGLALLLAADAGRAIASDEEPFVEAWLRPRALIDSGLALRGVASAALDLSDGLATDLRHLCTASGVGVELDLSAVDGLGLDAEHPRSFQRLDTIAARLANGAFAAAAPPAAPQAPLSGRQLRLTGGEVYGLLFTLPPGRLSPIPAARIGTISAAPAWPPELVGGHDHFGAA